MFLTHFRETVLNKKINMKKKILLFIAAFISLNLAAQDIQIKIDKHFTSKSMDSIINIINEITKSNIDGKNRYLTYWNAYALYRKSLLLNEAEGNKKEADKELSKAKKILEKTGKKNAEDYALLGMLYNYSIAFANFVRQPFLSNKAKSFANEAIRLNSQNPRAYLVLGINDYYTPVAFGGQTKCKEYFLKAIELEDKVSNNDFDPSWGKNEAYYYLFLYYINVEKNVDEAKIIYRKALKLFPDDNLFLQFKKK
jgi:tetratricopeptide (TPR) repeat protein